MNQYDNTLCRGVSSGILHMQKEGTVYHANIFDAYG